MAIGLRNIGIKADIYVAVTGVASESVNMYKINKTVGQIYVVVLFQNSTYKFETILPSSNRNKIREDTVKYILEKITEVIQKV
jgi:nicotinamide mononucleotide (NMN) deamidase PncC